MKLGLNLVLTVVCLALVAACGGEDPASSSSSSSSSSSGGGSSASTSSGGGASSSTSSGGAGGEGASTSSGGAGGSSSSSGEVCHPSEDDPQLQNCLPGDPCECNETMYTSKEYCDAWKNVDVFICPEDANVCSPGHNRCGYDLPKGEDYVLPDKECLQYVDGDTWGNEEAEHDFASSNLNENGMMELHGLVSPFSCSYYTHPMIQGKKILWNQANRDQYESGEGEFSGDCKQITMRFYKPMKGDGNLPPYTTQIITFLHHGGE